MFGKAIEKKVSLRGSEVDESDGMFGGSVVDGEVKAFVVEIGEELVEEVDGRSVDGCHNDKFF